MLDMQSWLPRSSDGMNVDMSWLFSPSQPSNPHPSAIETESWQRAEDATLEIMQHIHPVFASEQRRRSVVEYVQRLIQGCLRSEVFPFGSVPLKTYLPEGDIDLTALGAPGHEDALAADVHRVLELEEHNKDAEFEIKDVQYIHAEVKLVKCLVQNIVVDISFNQIGGLCTLCFLEKVDQLIGKDHLFKRSIILIKAWCYYESRILGAHHGLISTYALETLVLYIFHLFHSSLDGPLAVLYRFLDYYSKFDWDNYCISLIGPVPISSLPELSAEAPENDGDNLLLTEEFLRHCAESFSAPPSRGLENHHRSFLQKHLNIVDALRESNNLGRSVSKANFYRIRSAFAYGARKLGDILLSSKDSIADEIFSFFTSTLDRHGSGERHDVRDGVSGSACTTHDENNAKSVISGLTENGMNRSFNAYTSYKEADDPLNLHGSVSQRPKLSKLEANGNAESACFEELMGNSRDPVRPVEEKITTRHSGGNHSNGSMSSDEENGFSNLLDLQPELCDSSSWRSGQHMLSPLSGSNEDSMIPNNGHFASRKSQRNFAFRGVPGNCINESTKQSKMADLNGDFDAHWTSLCSARSTHKSLSSGLPLSNQHVFHPYHHKPSSDAQLRQSLYPQMNPNGMIPAPPIPPVPYYPINPHMVSGMYGTEDVSKPRGTGTYFPNTSFQTHEERRSRWKGRNLTHSGVSPRFRNNGRPMTPPTPNFAYKGSHEQPPWLQSPTFSVDGREKVALDMLQASHPSFRSSPWAVGIAFPPDDGVGSASSGPVLAGSSLTETGKKLDSPRRNTGSGSNIKPVQTTGEDFNSERHRHTTSYELKDEDDFPPLSA